MRKPPIGLQDLRRKIYIKAKAEKSWRFWGLYVHVCKQETLRAAYDMARSNNGAPGIDGVTFADIEESGVEKFLGDIRDELISETYSPLNTRKKEIPKGKGSRILSIPSIRDRVVQGALKLILEPVFEADFQDGSYGYRPKRTAHQAVTRVAEAIVREHTKAIDIDLASYFDTVWHDILLRKVASRIDDDKILRLLKLILKSSGKRGLSQGGTISPLLSNLYLNEVDRMLEKAKEATSQDGYTHIEYARFGDDLVILIDNYRKWEWLEKGVFRRLQEELSKIGVQLNEEKTRVVDLRQGEIFGFLGFDFSRRKSLTGKWRPFYVPKMKARTSLLRKLKEIFRRHKSQPVRRIIELINPILRGWTNYFRIGDSSSCFGYIQDWVEKKVRRHLMGARGRRGFGWKRWSRNWLYEGLGLYRGYQAGRP